MSNILIPNAVPNKNRNKIYRIDKAGNLIEENYNFFKDPYTLVTLCVILLGVCYYFYGIDNNPFAVKNIDVTCENLGDICGKYLPMKDAWIQSHPGEELNVRQILSAKAIIKTNFRNISLLNNSYINFTYG